ncbi:conserved hypothetical protein [Coccidioides posadasii str. Silveira]|uniref:Uncharacterized protein n=2 Tax=Coccidioides posadasii TaxID=199306 RepID=E9DIT5_COCPS|nr:conserved hypothetical protein [Coccidioides posadasii str. Silveira]KMM66585.1 hypothetical protein CPAG_02923 [Coccidioides posadasii RMSCC 3488]
MSSPEAGGERDKQIRLTFALTRVQLGDWPPARRGAQRNEERRSFAPARGLTACCMYITIKTMYMSLRVFCSTVYPRASNNGSKCRDRSKLLRTLRRAMAMEPPPSIGNPLHE